jgi:hypothetical protein
VCQQSVTNQLPSITAVQESLDEISERLAAFVGDRPALQQYMSEQRTALETVQNRLRERRSAISALRSNEAASLNRFDPTMAQAFVAGRVQLYLEGLAAAADNATDENPLSAMRKRVDDLTTDLDEQGVESRVRSLLNVASAPMTGWAQTLDLEYKNSPLHLNWKRLTLIADTDDGELPLSQMGSGKNWVGYHLIAHFALHFLFVKKRRPLPRFLFLDQPTQVFYPPERDVEGKLDALPDDDQAAVHRMFGWIRDRVSEVAPGFQVIITDHADLTEPYFQEAVVERWRGPKKLIPNSWLS